MNLTPLLEASLAIQIHTISAVLAFLLGACVLFRRKGDAFHRAGGKIWVVLMLVVCATSMFIHAIQMVGIWSPIHLLSISTTWFLYKGVAAARQRHIHEHQATMKSIYLGALVIAGFFTFMPGRIMHEVFFSGPDRRFGIAAALLIALIVCALVATVVRDTYRARWQKRT